VDNEINKYRVRALTICGVIIKEIKLRKEGRERLKTFVFKNKDENARLNNIRTVTCCTVKMR